MQKHLLIRPLRQQDAGNSERNQRAHDDQKCMSPKIHID
jgi:hypothetical protein